MARACFLFFAALLAAVGQAGAWLEAESYYEQAPGIEVEVRGTLLSELPAQGYAPLRIEIVNGSNRDRTWRGELTVENVEEWRHNVQPDTQRHTQRFSVSCLAGETISREVMVAIPTSPEGNRSITASFQLSSNGLSTITGNSYSGSSRSAFASWPATGMGSDFGKLGGGEELVDMLRDRKPGLGVDILELEMQELSDDWRSLSGLDLLILSETDWDALDGLGKIALVDWLHLGGHLHLYLPYPTEERLAVLQIPGIPAGLTEDALSQSEISPRKVGLGQVTVFKGTSKSVSSTELASRGKEVSSLLQDLHQGYRRGWDRREFLGDRELTPKLIMAFMGLFFIAVGPVNFFFLASREKRHRLFLTVPVFALLATLGILLAMFGFGGIGGNGSRFVLVELAPPSGLDGGASRAFVTEESAVQTELLLGSGFEMPGRPLLLPVMLRDSRYAHFSKQRSRNSRFEMTPDGTFGDGWMASRGDYGFLARSVMTTRERIEFGTASAGGEPTVVSGLGVRLEKFFVIAPDGKVWTAKAAASSGSEIALQLSSQKAMEALWEELKNLADSPLAEKMGDCPSAPGQFIGVADESASLGLGLGAAVEWQKEIAVLFGQVMTVASGAAKEAAP